MVKHKNMNKKISAAAQIQTHFFFWEPYFLETNVNIQPYVRLTSYRFKELPYNIIYFVCIGNLIWNPA